TSTDDSGNSFDRSLGTVKNAGDRLASAQDAAGTLQTTYDVAGDLTSLPNSATRTSSSYAWDEIGALVRATRGGEGQPGEQEKDAYDGDGRRVLTAQTAAATGTTDYTVHVLGSLVLEHAAFQDPPGDYERDAQTEHVYLNAGAMRAHVFASPHSDLPISAN